MTDTAKKPKLPNEYVLFYNYLQKMLMDQGVDVYNDYMKNGHKQLLDELDLGIYWEACLKIDANEFLN